MPRKARVYDRGKSARRLARERIGSVPPTRPIVPKVKRKKPKYKPSAEDEEYTD